MNKYGFFLNQQPLDYLATALTSEADCWTVLNSPQYVDAIRRIVAARPNAKVTVRYHQPGVVRTQDPRENAQHCYNDFYIQHAPYTRRVFPLNEPILEEPGVDVTDPYSLAEMYRDLDVWMSTWIMTFKQLAPTAYIIYPPPAPGNMWDMDDRDIGTFGIHLCQGSLSMADGYALNLYWNGNWHGLNTPDAKYYAFRYQLSQQYLPNKPCWISEFNGHVTDVDWVDQYAYFINEINKSAHVEGATCFLLNAQNGQFPLNDISRRTSIGQDMLAIKRKLAAIPTVPLTLEDYIREQMWNTVGVNYNSDASLSRYARAHELGMPETGEIDLEYQGKTIRVQAFVKGIVYCIYGQWDKVFGPILW